MSKNFLRAGGGVLVGLPIAFAGFLWLGGGGDYLLRFVGGVALGSLMAVAGFGCIDMGEKLSKDCDSVRQIFAGVFGLGLLFGIAITSFQMLEPAGDVEWLFEIIEPSEAYYWGRNCAFFIGAVLYGFRKRDKITGNG